MNFFTKTALLGLCALGLSNATVNYPFPQNSKYNGNGTVLSDQASAATQLASAFSYYYTTFYNENGNYAAIRSDPGSDSYFSEGVGYGMLMMVYFSSDTRSYQAEFDKIWALYKAAEDKNGLMNWKIGNVDPTTVWGENAATDAEMDVAAALIMAAYQFGDTKYLTEAQTLLKNVRAYEFETNGQHKPGDNWNDKKNPSYIAPAYYKLFADVDTEGATFWSTTAMEANYALLEANANASTGLFDNWCNSSGSGLDGYYGYDAARAPWRLSQAIYWFNDSRALALNKKLGAWVNNQAPSSVGGSITTSGSMGSDHNSTFVATLMTSLGSDASYQSKLDAYWAETVSLGDEVYFQQSMKILSGLAVSGNMPNLAAQGASSGSQGGSTGGESGGTPTDTTGSVIDPGVGFSATVATLAPTVHLDGRTLAVSMNGKSRVDLVALDGRTQNLWNGLANGSREFSLANMKSGVYLVKVQSESATSVKKINLK